MSHITHICLSDMHFGAESSLLTAMDGNRPIYNQASPVLKQLVTCLRALAKQQPSAPRPTLVLAGDILEMAIASNHQAAMSFEQFLKLAFPKNGENLFDSQIVYVPGNHDHHMWETARENHYLDYLNNKDMVPEGSEFGEQWNTTRLIRTSDHDWPASRLLTGLAHRNDWLKGINLNVSTAYPNMGVRSRDGKRCAIITHGHYIESIYQFFSDFSHMIFPETTLPQTLAQLERENFSWIDFFWSALGRSGAIGDEAQQIYEMLGTEAGIKSLGKRLSDGVTEKYLSDNRVPDFIERTAIEKLFVHLFSQSPVRERNNLEGPLSNVARKGLKDYLDRYLIPQLKHECPNDSAPEDISIIFGHTHKPFEEMQTIDTVQRPIEVLNTGGWVVDTVDRQSLHGGSIVVIDDACECAAIRMYNETVGDEQPLRVRVQSTHDNALSQQLRESIDANTEPWSSFTQIAQSEVQLRADALASRIRRY